MTPRVSVIIRTYNRADLLGEAIDSVLGQSWRDLELIVVDDGSTDATPALLERYAGRLTPIFLGRTANPAAVFNAGIRAARGEFVAFLDSDDIWLPDKLQRQIECLDSDRRFGLAYGNVRLLYPDGRLSEPVLAPDQIVVGSVLRPMVRSMCVHPSTVVIRRHWFDRIGLFDERILTCEEYFFLLDLALTTEAVCIPEPVCLIRRHAGQLSTGRGLATYQAAITALEGLLHRRTLPAGARLDVHRSIACHHTHLARMLLEAGQVADSRHHIARALWRYPLHRPAWRWALYALTESWGSRWRPIE